MEKQLKDPFSGENKEMHLQRQFHAFQERNKGKIFKHYQCAEWLRDKPKWVSVIEDFTEKLDGKEPKEKKPKIERPTGKKRATKDKEKRDLVESIAKDVVSEFIKDNQLEGTQKTPQDAKSVIASETAAVITAITEHKNKVFGEVFGSLQMFMNHMMKSQELSTPDKSTLKKRKAELALKEMEARSELVVAELKAQKEALENKENKNKWK